MISRRGFAAAAFVGTLLVAGQASAHAHLVSSNPADKAAVAAPKTIALTFSEKLTPAFSGFELEMSGHNMKVPVKTEVSSDGKTITGTPQGALMKGAYTVNWHAASSDGHRMTGKLTFTVN